MEIEDAAENLEQQPAAPVQDPKELARILADELVQRATPAQQAAPRSNKVQQTIERYLSKGVSKEGIETLLDILKARDEDRDAELSERAAQHAEKQFNNALYASAEEAIEEFADKIPNFDADKKEMLVRRMSAVMSADAEAKGIMEKGKIPARRYFQRAADKVVDAEYSGVIKKRAPLEIKSNTKAKSNDDDGDPTSGLDADEKKFYFAIKNALGEDKAKQAIQKARAAK